MGGGLQQDGGISFGRPKTKDKEPEKEIEEKVKEPRNVDIQELAKAERLNAKQVKAKGINY